MNMRAAAVRLCLPLLLAALSAGCATNSRHPTVNTWCYSHYSPTLTNTIAMTLQVDPNAENMALGQMLKTEMEHEGFIFAPIEKADYLMACTIENEYDVQPQRIILSTAPSPPQTTGQILCQTQSGSPYYTGSAPGEISSTPVVFHHKGIRLFLYNNPRTHPGRLELAWQGYVNSGLNLSADREAVLIKALLGYFGKEQHGPVNLPQ